MLSEQEKYLIIQLYKNGYTIKQVAESMKINKKTVVYWIQIYVTNNNTNGKKRVYKNKTSESDDKKIFQIIENKPKANLSLIVKELELFNIIISKTSVWRRMKENGYKYGNYLNKPKLTENHKLARLEWAQKYIDYDWSKVLFSDEATIYLNAVGKCWYKVGHRQINRTSKCIIKKNMWAFINLTYGLCGYDIFAENMDSNKYENILTEHLIVAYNDNLSFQQDNHPVHKSKRIQLFLKENNVIVIDWPANSPDINPIENLWSLVKYNLTKQSLTIDNFEKLISDTIENIDFSLIHNMISNMHVRLHKVITNKGDIIDY